MNGPERQHLHHLPRREFLKRTFAAASVATLHRHEATAAGSDAGVSPGLIDVNVHLSRWPTRRLPADDPATLLTRLRDSGITQAWAGSFEALLHKDVRAVNSRLVRQCQRHGNEFFVPIGTVNPVLPDWENDFEQCAGKYRMPALRLFPNYHGYTLDHPEFVRLTRLAADRGVVLQLAVLMEDERMMHPRLRVAPVDLAPLAALVRKTPELRLVLLNALGILRDDRVAELFQAGEVCADIATLEGVGGLDKLLSKVPLDRVLFGSHAPFYYVEAALLKLQESALSEHQLKAISHDNARRLLANHGK